MVIPDYLKRSKTLSNSIRFFETSNPILECDQIMYIAPAAPNEIVEDQINLKVSFYNWIGSL